MAPQRQAAGCQCDSWAILAMGIGDARLVMMGRDAAMLWTELMVLIKEHGTDGAIMFDGPRQFFNLGEIARLLRTTVAELEFLVREYAANGLISYQAGDGGSLALPVDLMPSARGIQARINGRKGGRPRTAFVS